MVPDTDSGTFDLLVNGEVKKAAADDGDGTGKVRVPVTYDDENEVYSASVTVSEEGANDTDLNNYDIEIDCGSDKGGNTDQTSYTFEIAAGENVVCTITNTLIVSGSDGLALYLHNRESPPTGNTRSQQNLPMSGNEPTAETLFNYDTDRDAFPGRLIQKGGSATTTDRVKYQSWRYTAGEGGLVLSGDAELTFYSGMKDFPTNSSNRSKRGIVQVFLRDCPAGSGSCTTIASETVNRKPWHSANQWMEDTVVFARLDYTIAEGRTLEVRFIVHSNSDDDMWFAYDTEMHPAKLVLE
jgi:hypothetical protein